ncbi:hypothetical protein MKEN_00889400 [Mycena kentingensis (nom. inval.)]|nr:hypothetical protein MKEN_00889400 [Mycena kentingensis (nom. inval.)]
MDDTPRISIDTMRAWIRIKQTIQHEIEQQTRSYATQNNLQPDSLLISAQQFTEQLFKIAQANIRVNGRDYDSLQPHEQDAEPFDEALDRQIWAIAGTRLEWHTKLGTERRDIPPQIADRLQAGFRKEQERDEAWEEGIAEGMDEDDGGDGPMLDLDKSVTREILAVAGELAQTLPAQHERAQRSERVEAEIKALRP